MRRAQRQTRQRASRVAQQHNTGAGWAMKQGERPARTLRLQFQQMIPTRSTITIFLSHSRMDGHGLFIASMYSASKFGSLGAKYSSFPSPVVNPD